MMGGQSSKSKSGGGDVSFPPLPINDARYAAALSSYEAECLENPDLKSFDVQVHERTSRALNSLAGGVAVGSLSMDALMEVTDFLLEMNGDAVKIILKSKEDVWNKGLFSLVEAFFDNSLKVLEFSKALEESLRRTRDSQFIIKLAVKKFESDENGDNGERYVKTFEDLKKFQEAGDPFGEEFVTLFRSLYKEHLSMFKKLQHQKKKLDKKYSTMETWKTVSNVILVTAFASVLIFSVVAAAMSAPPVVIALGAALAVPMGPVGKWCNTLWNRYLNSIKVEKQLLSSMEGHSFIILKDFENIRLLVRRLSIQLGSLLQNANLGIREQGAMQLVIDEIKKNLEGFDETIEKLSAHATKCSTDVTKAREVILQKIARQSNS
ncbi:UPF0496 protein At2g18630 [Cucumis sativus]|uniref:Uncharacterized protein n=1 Tax=Cucumis sativus TaxID=3659 RepID=A0A0A0LM33_CUCSA|nr:UPF0496 protein At2g18630 [Cucumis sativus]XP_011649380.1 UPF0496 protein At2g18630 [Cucumis sativus]KGN62084.1 hypothetical protein Csa_005929 [Cucumis sativus]